MEIKQLEYLVACAECGSFGKASEVLFTTQANISKVISKLEDELGYKLFERSSSGVFLTSGGRAVYEASKEILQKTEYITLLQRCASNDSFYVASVYDEELAHSFSKFIYGRADVHNRFGFYTGNMEEVFNYVASERAMMGFIYAESRHRSSMNYILHKKQLDFHTVGRADLLLYFGEQNPLNKLEELTVNQLKNLDFVCFESDLLTENDFHVKEISSELNITKNMNRALYTNSESFLKSVLTETNLAYLRFS